jgi:hypothetical protein
MKSLRTCLLFFVFAGFLVNASGCRKNEQGEGSAEQAGKQVDKALEQAGEEGGKLLGKAGEAMKEAGDKLEKRSQAEKSDQ